MRAESGIIEKSGRHFRPYPKYKDSGVEWLGEIPERWEVWKVTHGFNRVGSGTTPKSDNLAYYDGDINWVTTSELRENLIDEVNTKITLQALKDYSTLKIYPPGTLLFAMYGATIGRLGLLEVPAAVNQACCAFSEPIVFYTKFFYYWLIYRRPILISLSVGGGQPNLSQEDLKSLRIPVPPISEQTTISSFLDRETSRIDTLISKKERQIELLKEKRSALISHAVTKGLPAEAAAKAGLDPNVKMKDSGIEWLGEIPEGWGICIIKHKLLKITDGAHVSPETKNGAYPFISTVDIERGSIDFENSLYTSQESYDVLEAQGCKPKIGDVLFSKDGTIGKTVVIERDINFVIASSLIIMRPNPDDVISKYLEYILQSQVVIEQIHSFVKGTALRRLSLLNIKKVYGIFPSIAEQKAIASFLDRETSRIDTIIEKVKTSIEKLHEYRSALISAAVTGKIDVRKEVA